VVLDVRRSGDLVADPAGGTMSPATTAPRAVTTATLVPRGGRLEVQLDGHRVGDLTGRYPLVDQAADFQYPLTCRARFEPDPEGSSGLRVFVPSSVP